MYPPPLDPCKHCGGKAEFDHDDDGYYWVMCNKCPIITDTIKHAEQDAMVVLANAWNAKAPILIPDGYCLVPKELILEDGYPIAQSINDLILRTHAICKSCAGINLDCKICHGSTNYIEITVIPFSALQRVHDHIIRLFSIKL